MSSRHARRSRDGRCKSTPQSQIESSRVGSIGALPSEERPGEPIPADGSRLRVYQRVPRRAGSGRDLIKRTSDHRAADAPPSNLIAVPLMVVQVQANSW
jgi:hypothetical protein